MLSVTVTGRTSSVNYEAQLTSSLKTMITLTFQNLPCLMAVWSKKPPQKLLHKDGIGKWQQQLSSEAHGWFKKSHWLRRQLTHAQSLIPTRGSLPGRILSVSLNFFFSTLECCVSCVDEISTPIKGLQEVWNYPQPSATTPRRQGIILLR